MNPIIIAWRNLWRNKRRTIITASSIFFGVIFAAVMSSMQEGSYSTMIDNVVKFYSGYIQIHQEDYWENKTINNGFILKDTLPDKIKKAKEITAYSPRLESFALVSSDQLTKGAVVIGIDPEKENHITNPQKWIIRGRYLHPGGQGVMLGIDLANYLHLDVNDTLVLLGLGYHGINAAGKYPIAGIFKYPLPQFNQQFIYMDLHTAQDFYSADNLVTSLVLMVKDNHHLPKALRELKKYIHPPYQAMSWDEMQPELVQIIAGDRSGGKVMKAILYMIIGFGILGTVIMMVAERKREMGVMIAIGMHKIKLGIILFCETIYVGFIGVTAGIMGSLPIIAYFYRHPIYFHGEAANAFIKMGVEPVFAFSWMPSVFYNQAITIFILILLIAIYPFVKAIRMNITQALHA